MKSSRNHGQNHISTAFLYLRFDNLSLSTCISCLRFDNYILSTCILHIWKYNDENTALFINSMTQIQKSYIQQINF